MNYNTIVFTILLIACIVACKKQQDSARISSISQTPKYELSIEEILESQNNILDLVREYEIICLETTEKSLLGSIGEILFIDDNILVHDEKFDVVLLFDETGKFITQIGELGHGPHQFASVNDVEVQNNKIFIFSNDSRKVSQFDSRGQFISSQKIDLFASDFAKLGDTTLFYLDQSFSRSKNFDNLQFFDANMQLIDSKLPFFNIRTRVSYSGYLKSFNHALFVTNPFSSDIYSIQNGKWLNYLTFNLGNFDLPEEAKKSISIQQSLTKDYSYVGNNFYSDENIIYLSFNHRGMLTHVVYDIRSGKIYQNLDRFKYVSQLHLFPILNKKDQFYYSYFQPDVIRSLYERDNYQKLKEENRSIYKCTKNEYESNPCIYKYKI